MIGKGFVDEGTEDMAADTDGKMIDFDVLFVDDAGLSVPDGSEGEIIARGPAQAAGYVDRAETAKSFDAQGYFHTGDLGYRTAGGAVVITGRKKDLIISGGFNIFPVDIEAVVGLHEDVLDVSVIAIADPKWGETPLTLVIARHADTDAVAIREWANARLSKHQRINRLEIVTELPRNALGKVLKRVLRERYC